MLKIKKDVKKLHQIRGLQKRLRGKHLTDNDEANEVMDRYACRKPNPYLARYSSSLKLELKRWAHPEDEFFVGTDTKDPLRIWIELVTQVSDEYPEPEDNQIWQKYYYTFIKIATCLFPWWIPLFWTKVKCPDWVHWVQKRVVVLKKKGLLKESQHYSPYHLTW